jgi:hypothetical protein
MSFEVLVANLLQLLHIPFEASLLGIRKHTLSCKSSVLLSELAPVRVLQYQYQYCLSRTGPGTSSDFYELFGQ